jgi:hypothetical protein
LSAWFANSYVPAKLSVSDQKQMVAMYKRRFLFDWCNTQFSELGGHTPREVVGDPAYAITLEGLVLSMELNAYPRSLSEADIAFLKAELKIPEQSPIDASKLDELPQSQLQRRALDFATLTDEQLIQVQTEAALIGNPSVMRRAIPELLKRESLADKVPPDECYTMLAFLTEDDDQALELLKKARQLVRNDARKTGILLVREFDLRLGRGLFRNLAQLLNTIQSNYIDDAQVEFQLGRVLQKYDLLSEDGKRAIIPIEREADEDKPILWTPDQGVSNVAIGDPESRPKSTIWVPD